MERSIQHLALLFAMLCSLGCPPSSAVGQLAAPIPLADLPPPSDAIGKLIADGGVSFQTGGRPRPGGMESPPGVPLAAETRYQIVYNYRSRSRWTVSADHQQVIIRARFSQIEWRPKHTVWLRDRPAAAGFWSDKLVRHELDHVRISSDPRWRTRFEERLKQQSVIRRPIRADDVVNRQYVDRLVGEHVAAVFAEITDLIAIRYKELDRLTRHGQLALPADWPLNDF